MLADLLKHREFIRGALAVDLRIGRLISRLWPWFYTSRRSLIVMEDERKCLDRDQDDAAILDFDVDDAAIEIAAMGIGTIPTASVNMIPPNCCVQRPSDIVVAGVSRPDQAIT